MSQIYDQLSEAVLGGDLKNIKKLAQTALDGGSSAQQVLDLGLLPGMDEVGKLFKTGAMFIPEVLLSAKTMAAAMERCSSRCWPKPRAGAAALWSSARCRATCTTSARTWSR